jgi:uncharacterized peroxidase-related enzyme
MDGSSLTGLVMVEEHQASDEVKTIYDEVKRTMQVPLIPNGLKSAAISPAALTIYWNIFKSFYQHSTLPQSLTSMILYAIAETRHCQYCSATNELTCRTLGVDEETLSALVKNLNDVNPARVRAIIEFAVKVSQRPQELVSEDYDRVRAQGLTDAELVEIILIAALGNLNDTIADALKVQVETSVTEALSQRRG